jgi:hypothetical protein
LKIKRPKRPADIRISDVATNRDVGVLKSSEHVTGKSSVDKSPIPGQHDGAVPTQDVEAVVQADKEDSQAQGSPDRSINTPSTIPLSGRKRAFSDPGDVKRPSTAGTDRRLEALSSQAPHEDSYTPGATVLLSEGSVPQYPPTVIDPPFVPLPAQARAGYTVPAYMSLGQPVPYQGFGYAGPISVSFDSWLISGDSVISSGFAPSQTEHLQYYPYPNANQLPPFSLGGQNSNVYPEQVHTSRALQYGGNGEYGEPRDFRCETSC